jgi:ankyrin repeat protein
VNLFLDKGADVNTLGGELGSALQVAAHNGNKSMVKLLLEKGADVNTQGGKGSVLIYAAASYKVGDCEEVVRLFLDHGADINCRGEDGWTALYRAAIHGKEGICRLLLRRGADMNAVYPRNEETALHRAAANGKVTVVHLLVDQGASINSKSKDGKTALDLAVENEHEEVVRTLRKAHTESKVNNGKTLKIEKGWLEG